MTRSANIDKSILVLDNSQSLVALYKAELEDLGARVTTFKNGAQALAFVHQNSLDLMIVGAELEDTHCLELVQQIRDSGPNQALPIIVLSSSDSIAFRAQCFKLGVADFIPRNASQEYFLAQVQVVLGRLEQYQPEVDSISEKSIEVLVAEDSTPIQGLYRLLLEQMGAKTHICDDGQAAWEFLAQNPDRIDLVITDLEMPRLSGRELLQRLKADRRFSALPIIVVTRFEALTTAVDLLSSGATDYIHKPFRPEELQARITTHLSNARLLKEQQQLSRQLRELNGSLEEKVRSRTAELNDANNEMMLKLALVCDYKDEDTGNHINRVRLYCLELGRAAGIPESELEHFSYSSMLHDVGKVGIPDSILKKPGPLDADEWQIMRTHTTKGAELLGNRAFFKVAREIAHYHHERVDGTGYPDGLSGDSIPLSARIAAVVDVFDALTSKRSYKEAWTIEESLEELQRMTEGHLDATLVAKLAELERSGKLSYIKQRYP